MKNTHAGPALYPPEASDSIRPVHPIQGAHPPGGRRQLPLPFHGDASTPDHRRLEDGVELVYPSKWRSLKSWLEVE